MDKIKEHWIVENETEKFGLEFVEGLATPPDSEREFYRVVSPEGTIHYKGINVSRSRIVEDQNKGIKKEDIFTEGRDRIENALIMGDKRNIEFVFHSDRNFIRELDKDGGYKDV